MTQLSKVDPKSARHFSKTQSSMPSSPEGSSMRRNLISLKFFSTWTGEWWVTLLWSKFFSMLPLYTWLMEEMGRLLVLMNCLKESMGLRRDETKRRSKERDLLAAEEDVFEALLVVEEGEDEWSSSEMTQSTRTTMFSTWETREWMRLETTQHRPKALTSPILLKTSKRSESGNRSKWSTGSGKIFMLRSAFTGRISLFISSSDKWTILTLYILYATMEAGGQIDK